jgi:prepilin-type N-terminal cleavage/methylation domain-containing protein
MRSTDASFGSRRGFSLVEIIVTLGVLSVVMVGLYSFLGSSNKFSKQETQVGDAQAATRSGIYEVARLLRQVRVGQLYYGNAVLPANSVDSSYPKFTDLDGKDHAARPGTDVLEVRGVLFDQTYFFDSNAVTGTLNGTLTVQLKNVSSFGVRNFPDGVKPPFANRPSDFWFLLASSESGVVPVTKGGTTSNYLNTLYYVGLVDHGSFDLTANVLTFTMKCTNGGATLAGATRFYPTGTAPTTLMRPFAGGPLDDVFFFVDQGSPEPGSPTTFTHPFLAQAALDAGDGSGGALKYDIQPLAEEVEDFQVVYGVDGIQGLPHDRGVDPATIDPRADKDEWVYNVPGETALVSTSNPTVITDFIDTTVDGSTGQNFAQSALRSVMVGILAKSADPNSGGSSDENFLAGDGYLLFDSAATPIGTNATGKNSRYRRRVRTMAVNLRNYL